MLSRLPQTILLLFFSYVVVIQFVRFVLAQRGIAWHSPIASWRKTNAYNFWSVWHAAAFELLCEEATHKDIQPMVDDLLLIHTLKCDASHKSNLLAGETVAQEIVEEEIVQLVWSYFVFGDLCDISFFIGRQQLW